MQDKILQKISDIHKSNIKFVIVSSGGGSNAIASLLKVPGASNSILESYIPYSRESLDFYLLKQPDFYCSKDTSLRMAAKAYSAAKKIDQNSSKKNLFGVAITAALSTTYQKKGDHKFHIALQTEDYSKSISCVMKKGVRTREQEEELVTAFVVNMLLEAAGLDFSYPEMPETYDVDKVCAKEGWRELMREEIQFISSHNEEPKLIFPGAFNPIHKAHLEMAALAKKQIQKEVFFEVCIQNADKPPLSYHQIDSTLKQFTQSDKWVLTKTGKFSDKAMIFKDATFIIGADTLLRMLNEKFYPSYKSMIEEFEIFNQQNTKFLVFGRVYGEKFITLNDISLPENIKQRFEGFGEDIFRSDISSSQIRVSEDS